MTHAVRVLLLALAAVFALTLAACGDDDDDTGAGATTTTPATLTNAVDASELTVYSGRDEELVAPLFERFEEENDIKLNVRYGDTSELAATIVEEGDNSPADVFFGQDAGALGALQKENRFATLPPAVLDQVDEPFRSQDGAWVGTSARARVIAFDTREVQADDLPDSVFGLTDEQWKGKVGWAPTNASFQAFVTAMRKIEGDEKTEQWLRDMKANDAKAYDKNGLIRDAIADGEVQVGLINHYYVLQTRAEEGDDYPVDIGFVDGGDAGALVNVAGGGVLASSEKQAAAAELLEFLLTAESQTFFAEETFEYPLAGGVAAPAGVPSLEEIQQPNLDLSDLDDLQGTLTLIEQSGVL